MVFKLVRIDTQEPSKILLLTGKHVIGRGRFLHDDDTDKRVSRNHAELEVSEDSISLKSLHQNPCFIIKKSTTETELLQINNTVALTNGDKFGLLPDNFWYEVLHCTAQENDSSEAAVEPNNALNNNSLNGLEDTQVNESNDKQSSDTIVNGGVDEENRVEVKVEAEELNNSESLLNQDTDMYTNPQVPADDASPRKRNQSRSPSPDGLKRVKTEPVTPGGDQAGPSNDSDADQKPAIPTQPVKTPDNLPRRERCIYGANCYRMENATSRVSAGQWDTALEFFECHPSLIQGYNNSSRGRQWSRNLWQKLTNELHSEVTGATKTPKAWATYFNNHKAKLKKKLSTVCAEVTATGEGPDLTESLSDYDLRFVALLGPGFGQGHVTANTFPNTRAEQQTPEPGHVEIPDEMVDEEIVSEGVISISPEPSTSGIDPAASGPPGVAPVQPRPIRIRRPRYHTRLMTPIEEARRMLSQARHRAAVDAEHARALRCLAHSVGLVAHQLGRMASAMEARNTR